MGNHEKFLFFPPQKVLIYFMVPPSIKKRFCNHVYRKHPQHSGRDLLVCRKCGNVEEVPE